MCTSHYWVGTCWSRPAVSDEKKLSRLLWLCYFNAFLFLFSTSVSLLQLPSMCGFSRERHKKVARLSVAFLFKGTPPSLLSPHTHRRRKHFVHVYSQTHSKLQRCLPDCKGLFFKGTTVKCILQKLLPWMQLRLLLLLTYAPNSALVRALL